jgi:ATP-dependent Clp protease ATP-binding subunit ClpA
MSAIQKLFTPEFRNRLDAIIQFNGLDRPTMLNVVDKFLFDLEQQLEEKRVTLQVSGEAREWLAEKGYDEKMGARPMARVIQEHIKKSLAEELLFGRLAQGGRVSVTVSDGELAFEFEGAAVH